MDKGRVKGIGNQVSGSIKEAVGKITGDTKTEAEGAAQKAAGKAEKTVGGAKDKVRNALND